MKTLFIISLVLINSVLGIVAYESYANPQIIEELLVNKKILLKSDKSAIDLEFEQMTKVEKSPKDVNKINIGGWIPDWDLTDGFQTLQDNPQIKYVSPFWLMPQEDGSIKEVQKNINPEIIEYTKSNNIKLIPSSVLFDPEILSKILETPENMERHINELVDKAVYYEYDGIDLDYESTALKDKKLYFEFLEKLSKKLHDNGKLFSFTALSKWTNVRIYPTLNQTRMVQDYKRISDLADQFRIMTYDYYGSGSKFIGPVAPIKWMETVLQYAIKEGVDRNKIYLGVPTYSYDWSTRQMAPNDLDFKLPPYFADSDYEKGSAYFNVEVNKVKNKFPYTEEFNNSWSDMVLKYNYNGVERFIVYPNNVSIQLRKQLAADYGIAGIYYWKLGSEDGLKL